LRAPIQEPAKRSPDADRNLISCAAHRPVKSNQRLEYNRLAEVLAERGLVDPQSLREALQFSGRGNLPFPEALVSANLVSDWELSRVVCELYGLPFLPVDMYDPDPKAREKIDPQTLIENCVVPIGKFGNVLTICMPAMLPAEVLGLLASETDLHISPVVGTVRTNRKWLETNLRVQPAAPLPEATAAEGEANGEWSSIFDAGDAAVLLDLQKTPLDPLEDPN
jgi:hypothetical protein